MGLSLKRMVRGTGLVACLLWIASHAGCDQKETSTTPPPPPPPTVTVAQPAVELVVYYREYTGRTAAVESVEVRSRVSGYMLSVEFKEGMEVRKGDLLFRIDPRPYEADLREAEANLAAQEVQLQRYQLDLTRAKELIGTNAISQQELDVAIAAAASARAQLRSLEAAVASAKLELEYTEIRSPIAGRTSRALVTPGNLIVSDSTVLTSVVSMDPMYAYFDVDESSALDYRQRVRQSQVDSARNTSISVALGLSNETGYPHTGQIDFVDNVTDIGTGNIQIRARFPNTDGALLPGLFCRIRVPFTRPYDALLVPQTALAMNQQGRYVLVVDKQKKVELHVVEVGTSHGGLVAIRSGIDRDDRVVINGLQKARPGSEVEPVVEDAVEFVTRTLGSAAVQSNALATQKISSPGEPSAQAAAASSTANADHTGTADVPSSAIAVDSRDVPPPSDGNRAAQNPNSGGPK